MRRRLAAGFAIVAVVGSAPAILQVLIRDHDPGGRAEASPRFEIERVPDRDASMPSATATRIFRTYRQQPRRRGDGWSYLDLTALARQEEWEDSPEGYPQTPPYQWRNLHDEYEQGD